MLSINEVNIKLLDLKVGDQNFLTIGLIKYDPVGQ